VSERRIVIVAGGGANIASLQFALDRLEAPSMLSADPDVIRSASHVILPGVGAAASAMARLRHLGLFDSSQEGDTACLGIIPGCASRLPRADDLPVPHMGWNTLDISRPCALLEGVADGDYAYFVHSYAVDLGPATVAGARYGRSFSACVQWGNFYGTQFHPERSAAVGALLLDNFLSIH